MNATVQIAEVLNVSPNQIKSVREMAWVYCVVVFGQRATFVSKKKVEAIVIQEIENIHTTKYTSASGMVDWRLGRKFEEQGKIWETVARTNTGERWNSNVDDDEFIWQVEAKFVAIAK